MEIQQNIYRECRLRAREAFGKERFGSSEKAAYSLQQALAENPGREGADECHVSYASLKDYESGKTVPSPETVGLMAEVYGTPELKWLHCSESCPIGREIAHTDGDIGEDDIRSTYFDLAGTFDLADEIEARLHKVIEDGALDESELPVMEDVLAKLDRISESAKELRVWAERQRGAKG